MSCSRARLLVINEFSHIPSRRINNYLFFFLLPTIAGFLHLFRGQIQAFSRCTSSFPNTLKLWQTTYVYTGHTMYNILIISCIRHIKSDVTVLKNTKMRICNSIGLGNNSILSFIIFQLNHIMMKSCIELL